MCQDLAPTLILIWLNFLGIFLLFICFLLFLSFCQLNWSTWIITWAQQKALLPLLLVGKFCNVITPLCAKIGLAITVYSGFSCIFSTKTNLSIYWVLRPCFNKMFLMFVRIKRTSFIIVILSLLTFDFRLPILAFFFSES